jgi:hypothetical protein
MATWLTRFAQWLKGHAAPPRRVHTGPGQDDRDEKRAVLEASRAHEAGDFDRATRLALAVSGAPANEAAALTIAARAALRTRRHPGTWAEQLPPPPLEREGRLAAIELYRRAIERDPHRDGPRWELSRLVDAASDERLALLRELAAVRRSVGVLLDLGDCLHVRGDHDAARDAYEQAVQVARHDVEPYRRLELLSERLGDSANAKHWRRAASQRSLPRQASKESRQPAPAEGTRALAGTNIPPLWCAVANVVAVAPRGPGGELIREGTKHFKPGTKVYCFTAYWGTAGDRVRVVGRARKSHRWITVAMLSKLLCDARVKLCYEPAVLRRIADDVPVSLCSQENAERLAALINRVTVAAAPKSE